MRENLEELDGALNAEFSPHLDNEWPLRRYDDIMLPLQELIGARLF